MTQSSFANSQLAWQHDRQSNVPWRSVGIDATEITKQIESPKTTLSTCFDWLIVLRFTLSTKIKKKNLYASQKATPSQQIYNTPRLFYTTASFQDRVVLHKLTV